MADSKETENPAETTISGDSRQTHELSRYINSKYQDSVFKDLFKSRANLLALYRTLHPEDSLIKEEDLTLITIKNVLSNGVYNDVAFRAKDRLMILFEHQSSINWNMPLRLLIYYAEEIMGYLRQEGESLHQKDRILLPAVEFYVVYSGSEKWDVTRLCLSDSFKEKNGEKNGFLELTVKVIHKNDYRESILDDYLTFIYKVKENIDTYGRDEKNIRQAVLEAIDYCMENNILAGYLADRKREVFGMLMNEISVDEFGEIREREGESRGRREGRREGRKEGRKEGRREEEARFIISMYRKGYSLEQIAGVAEKSVEEIEAVISHKELMPTI